MKWLRLSLLLVILATLAIVLPVSSDPPDDPNVVYGWIGGSPVITDNENYQAWIGGHPYGITRWVTSSPSPDADVELTYSVGPVVAPTVTNGAGATGVTDNDARLNGEITDNGNENPSAWVFWGTVDGGTDPGSWSNNSSLGTKPIGAFYYDAGSLNDNTLYYYRMSAVNSGGTGWAASSANFTTLASLLAPTGFTLTDMGAISINATWSQGVGASYTMVRIKRNEAPADTTDGELFYYGDNVTAAMAGFSFDVTQYVARAWSYESDNVTYSADYAEASIGGDGMTGITEQMSIFNQYFAILPALAAIIMLSIWAYKTKYPVAFVTCFGVSLVAGLWWFNEFGDSMSLAISLALIVYSLYMAGTALWSMFAPPEENEE